METDYCRQSCAYDSEDSQNVNIKYVRYNIKSMYPQKIISSILDEPQKTFLASSTECEHKLDFRAKDKSLKIANTYFPSEVKNQKKSKQFPTKG